jgi:hypothetical protein
VGDDQIADVGRRSERLHQELPGSEFIEVPGAAHMVHHHAPDQVVAAIDRVAQLAAPAATSTELPIECGEREKFGKWRATLQNGITRAISG